MLGYDLKPKRCLLNIGRYLSLNFLMFSTCPKGSLCCSSDSPPESYWKEGKDREPHSGVKLKLTCFRNPVIIFSPDACAFYIWVAKKQCLLDDIGNTGKQMSLFTNYFWIFVER
uniref:Uncharacterized protein n=1 Tax=Micrurus carvalhoi TaxID=3147026 RepID=A0A2H6N8C2_9SAUR